MLDEEQKKCVCKWKLGTAIRRGLNLRVFSVNGTSVIREVPQDPNFIHDFRLSCPYRGWHNFMF